MTSRFGGEHYCVQSCDPVHLQARSPRALQLVHVAALLLLTPGTWWDPAFCLPGRQVQSGNTAHNHTLHAALTHCQLASRHMAITSTCYEYTSATAMASGTAVV
jgi:hypothetical protein